MELALITAKKTIVMAMLALLGIISYKCKIIDKELNKRLSNLVLTVFTPVLLFISLQRTYTSELVRGLIISALLSALSFLIIWLVSKLVVHRHGKDKAVVEHISLIYSNCGFIGIPMAQGIWGTEGVFYMTTYVALANFLLWTHGIIAFTGEKDIKSLKKVFSSPTIIAILAGLVCFVCQLKLPSIILEPMELVANVNTPMAMMVAGINIAQADLNRVFRKGRVYFLCFVKLIIMPMIMLMILSLFPVEQTIKMVIILACSCPAGVTGSLFALQFGKDAVYASEIFAMTTMLSVITVPAIMFMC